MRYYIIVLSSLLLLTLTGCVDEVGFDPSSQTQTSEGTCLTFTVKAAPYDDERLSRSISYSDPTYYEDWIDTQDKFRVLFFVSKRKNQGQKYQSQYEYYGPDYFLFESKGRWVTQGAPDGTGHRTYQVTVPLYDVGNLDSDYSAYWGRIRDILRSEQFKVVILANHPVEPPTSGAPANAPAWTFKDSYLYNPNSAKTINDLHHCTKDNTYDDPKRYAAYDFMLGKPYALNSQGQHSTGPWIDWVIMRTDLYEDGWGETFHNKEEAAVWIRNHWRPALSVNEDYDKGKDFRYHYRNYRHLWYVWNFGGTSQAKNLSYSSLLSDTNPYMDEWESRNGQELRNWVNSATTLTSKTFKTDGSKNNLIFNGSATSSKITYGGQTYYGVTLGSSGTFQFKMWKHGTIYVYYTGTTPTISYTGGGSSAKSATTSLGRIGPNNTEVKVQEMYLKVMDDPATIEITGSGCTIYQIELNHNEYLYLTDREGKIPSSQHPIPMYGVQLYEPIGDLWRDGSAFNLSEGVMDEKTQRPAYEGKGISLLRAVAKVEVLIPKSLGVPRHVYMRSSNRYVRCEPIDVQTPTQLLWKDHENGCEWNLIQKQGHFYGNATNTDSYRAMLKWYWGSWKDWDWTFTGYYLNSAPSGSSDNFPHIMNPFIQRSDFCAFINVTDFYNDQFYHYVYYMGENTLDAPTDHIFEKADTRPMVPSVEVRFDGNYVSRITPNDDMNLEDNDCYRFYFTEGGNATNSSNADSNGYTYEKSDAVNKHWPIIRNHYYRFVVRDENYQGGGLLVVDAYQREPKLEFN